MRPKQILAAIGFIALIAGTYCPLFQFTLMKFDIYRAEKPYGIVMLVVAIIGLAVTVINQRAIIKAAAWLSFLLVVLLLIGSIMKVNAAFSFIPFKGLGNWLTHKIHYKWGWWVLFGGAILAVLGSLGSKKPGIADYRKQNEGLNPPA